MEEKPPNGHRYSPRLETLLMVERFIQQNSGQFSRFQVWQRLPRKVLYQSYRVILEYLENSNKIAIGSDGKIHWVLQGRQKLDDLTKKSGMVGA